MGISSSQTANKLEPENPRKPNSQGKKLMRSKKELLAQVDLSAYPDLMRVTDIATVLCVSKQVVYLLIEEGELEALHIGKGCRRVFKGSVVDYLERQIQEN
ncbi:MAG: helix-turn-helix transcriptional regulator [Sumerlaeia bacterium]